MERDQLLKLLDNYKRLSTKRFKQIFCGKRIGEGVSREVFEFVLDKRYVVKIDTTEDFDNIMEWKIWHHLKDYKALSQHLAPCIWMMPNGKVLIQRKIRFKGKYPDKMPNLFTDLKYQNYGFIGKRIVCCDYSRSNLFKSGRVRKVKWWNGYSDIQKWMK